MAPPALPICRSCCIVLAPHRRPKAAEDTRCTHPVNICRTCWRSYLEFALSEQSPKRIGCMYCGRVMTQGDMRALAGPEVYQRYLHLELMATLSNIDNFHFCVAPTCKSGGLLEGEETCFACGDCGLEQCVKCCAQRHDGVACEVSREQRGEGGDSKGLGAQQRANEESATAQALEKTAKNCPGCNKKVVKEDGCDHMTCEQCGIEFCWSCLVDYENANEYGEPVHRPGCEHWHDYEGLHHGGDPDDGEIFD